jgi:outer membrane receptor protein involved in Fe transport
LNWTLRRSLTLAGVSLLFAASAPVARSQPTDPVSTAAALPDRQTADFQLEQVVVVGDRASLAAAAQRKRDAIGIVDSVVGDDIARLPDLNVTDALQRITGIQIQRDLGEGASPSIRGLTQMETLLNGREVFTAGTGRNLNFEDMPAEMISGIDVYKSSSAAQLEGGVGGTIDLRTHRPSENSLNLIGMYERGGLSVRVAYNWRDKFLSGVTNIVGVGALPIYTRAYGWLDASLRYRFTDKLSLAIEWINLLGTMRRSYYGVTTRPQSVWLDDTQLAVTLMIRI